MTLFYKIMIGVLIGLVIGAVNFFLLRAFVRLALKTSGRVWGALIIILSYMLRYLLIGVAVFLLMKSGEQMIALIVLAVLITMTLLLAALQQKRKSGAGG